MVEQPPRSETNLRGVFFIAIDHKLKALKRIRHRRRRRRRRHHHHHHHHHHQTRLQMHVGTYDYKIILKLLLTRSGNLSPLIPIQHSILEAEFIQEYSISSHSIAQVVVIRKSRRKRCMSNKESNELPLSAVIGTRLGRT